MARIYTRTGDQGQTSLFDGTRVSKADLRVDLYGHVDELNSWLGICVATLHRAQARAMAGKDVKACLQELARYLTSRQADLFEMGAVLADPASSERLAAAPETDTPFGAAGIEQMIDRVAADLPVLKSFILPGGHQAAADLHVARTVCRRVERHAVAAAAEITIPLPVIVYLNRLGDFLFMAARWINQCLGEDDIIWHPRAAGGQKGAS